MFAWPRSVVSFTAGGFYYVALRAREKAHTQGGRGGRGRTKRFQKLLNSFLPNERYEIYLYAHFFRAFIDHLRVQVRQVELF